MIALRPIPSRTSTTSATTSPKTSGDVRMRSCPGATSRAENHPPIPFFASLAPAGGLRSAPRPVDGLDGRQGGPLGRRRVALQDLHPVVALQRILATAGPRPGRCAAARAGRTGPPRRPAPAGPASCRRAGRSSPASIRKIRQSPTWNSSPCRRLDETILRPLTRRNSASGDASTLNRRPFHRTRPWNGSAAGSSRTMPHFGLDPNSIGWSRVRDTNSTRPRP